MKYITHLFMSPQLKSSKTADFDTCFMLLWSHDLHQYKAGILIFCFIFY